MIMLMMILGLGVFFGLVYLLFILPPIPRVVVLALGVMCSAAALMARLTGDE